MVQLGIMSVETSQEILGLDPKKETSRSKQTQADEINEMFASGTVYGDNPVPVVTQDTFHSCGDCVYWEGSNNHCAVHQREKTFDDLICRQFSLGELSDVGSSSPDPC